MCFALGRFLGTGFHTFASSVAVFVEKLGRKKMKPGAKQRIVVSVYTVPPVGLILTQVYFVRRFTGYRRDFRFCRPGVRRAGQFFFRLNPIVNVASVSATALKV
jgi:hypothetical protein